MPAKGVKSYQAFTAESRDVGSPCEPMFIMIYDLTSQGFI